MGNPCPSVGLVMGFLATIGIIYTLASKDWKHNNQQSSSNVNMGIHSYEGLWVRCTSGMPGQILCDTYDESMLALPGDLQGQRALMVLALICSFGGIVAGALGLQCIAVMQGSKVKVYTGRSGGVLMILAGAMTITAVSWYAAGVIREFKFDQINQNSFAYEFGPALYVGWIAGGFALISGSLMACCARSDEDEDEYDPRPVYKPGKQYKAGRNAEYV